MSDTNGPADGTESAVLKRVSYRCSADDTGRGTLCYCGGMEACGIVLWATHKSSSSIRSGTGAGGTVNGGAAGASWRHMQREWGDGYRHLERLPRRRAPVVARHWQSMQHRRRWDDRASTPQPSCSAVARTARCGLEDALVPLQKTFIRGFCSMLHGNRRWTWPFIVPADVAVRPSLSLSVSDQWARHSKIDACIMKIWMWRDETVLSVPPPSPQARQQPVRTSSSSLSWPLSPLSLPICSKCCTLLRCRSAVLWPIHRLRAPPRHLLISAVQ